MTKKTKKYYENGVDMIEKTDSNLFCPFCNEKLDVELEDLYSAEGCETCNFRGYTSYTINVKCTKCNKVFYKKEVKKESLL